jgi:hypothetical protein
MIRGHETVDCRSCFTQRFRLPGSLWPAVGYLPAKLWLVGVRAGGEAEIEVGPALCAARLGSRHVGGGVYPSSG